MQNAEQEIVHEELVPLALISVETGEDVEHIAHRFAEAVELDDVGMRAVPVSVARRFFTELAEQAARQAERPRPDVAPVPAGIPFPEGADPTMSAFEVMRGADADAERSDPARRVSPHEEFLTQRLGPPRQVRVEEKP